MRLCFAFSISRCDFAEASGYTAQSSILSRWWANNSLVPFKRLLGSRVVSVLDSGAVGPELKSQPPRCRVTVLDKLFTPIVPLFTKQRKEVTAGLAESNDSLPPGLWLTSPAGWLPRTGISSGTLRSVIEYGQPLPFYKNPMSRLHHSIWSWVINPVVRLTMAY